MTVDLAPVVTAVVGLCAVAMTTFGSWALTRLAQKLSVQANNAAVAAFDDAIRKSVQAGASALQGEIAAKGWSHPEVKSAIVAWGAPYAMERFKDAMRGVGLDPDDPVVTAGTVEAALNRAFPTAIAPVAASPVTPPLPPSPPGTTAADLNRAEIARHQGAGA